MAIKVPDNFKPSDYGIEISIPKPDIQCEKNKDGSFSLRARYTYDGISGLAREAAREMNDKMEAALIDELLRLNGYVQERTCEFDSRACGKRRCKRCGAFVAVDAVWDCCGVIPARYCPNCGAKVVDEWTKEKNG